MGAKLDDLEFKAQNSYRTGPGQYQPIFHNGSPRTKIGTGARTSLAGSKESLTKPGPGNYTQNFSALMVSSPKFGFGSGKRNGMASTQRVPGPGAYETRKSANDGHRKTMSAILNYAPHMKETSFKPGPGAYDPLTKTKFMKKEPAWKMGTESQRLNLEFEKKKLF